MPAKPGFMLRFDDHDGVGLVDVEDAHAVDGASPLALLLRPFILVLDWRIGELGWLSSQKCLFKPQRAGP